MGSWLGESSTSHELVFFLLTLLSLACSFAQSLARCDGNFFQTVNDPASDCEDVAQSECTATTGDFFVLSRTNVSTLVTCDMTTAGGGWMVVYARNDSSSALCPTNFTANGPASHCTRRNCVVEPCAPTKVEFLTTSDFRGLLRFLAV